MPIFQGFNLCQFQSDVSLSDAEWNASGVILQISLESNGSEHHPTVPATEDC